MTQFRAWLPYAIIGLILVLTRIPELGLKAWLASFKLSFVDILGYQGVNASIDYLFLPGTIPFTLVAILTIGLHSMKANDVKDAWTTTFAKMKAPTIALFAAVALVSIFRGSGVNDAGMDSMPPRPSPPSPVKPGPPSLPTSAASAPSLPAPTPCPTCSSPSSSGIWPRS